MSDSERRSLPQQHKFGGLGSDDIHTVSEPHLKVSTLQVHSVTSDILSVCSRMRSEDFREVLDLTGSEPLIAIPEALKASWGSYNPYSGLGGGKVYVTYVEGNPEVIFGCGRSNTIGVGLPWLLGTDAISKIPLSVYRLSRMYVTEWLKEYPILTNIVDARNELHLRWLESVGFKFIADYPDSGPGKILVKQFCKVRL